MDNGEYLKVQDYYNQKEKPGEIEGFNKPPFWQLTDKEQEYYRWLMEKEINNKQEAK